MNYSNYRNNMPHYDSMTYNYDPMGINDYRVSQNSRLKITNTMPTMPGMPEDMFDRRPFIPDTEIPFDIDGDMPALPQIMMNQMPGMPGMPNMPGMPSMPGMPQPSMPGMPRMPVTQQPGMPMMPQPGMPGMSQPSMPQMPSMPGMSQPSMPGVPQPSVPSMPQPGMQRPCMPEAAPGDGNMYPSTPSMPNGMPPMTCEQLRDMMRRMNCPMNENATNVPRTVVPPENSTATPPAKQ